MTIEILNAIFGLIAGGGLSGLVFWRINRKRLKAEAAKTEAEATRTKIDNEGCVGDQWQEYSIEVKGERDSWKEEFYKQRDLAERYYSDMVTLREDKDKKIRELQKEVDKLKLEKEHLTEEKHQEELKCLELQQMKCEVKGCSSRRPPSELMM